MESARGSNNPNSAFLLVDSGLVVVERDCTITSGDSGIGVRQTELRIGRRASFWESIMKLPSTFKGERVAHPKEIKLGQSVSDDHNEWTEDDSYQ